MECTKIGQECDRRRHKTSCIEHYVFGGKRDRNPKVTVTTLKARGARQPEPDRQRRARPRRTPAQVRPPRPVLLGSKPAGQKADLETVFPLGAPRGKAIPGTGAWRGRKPSRSGGGAGGRGSARRGGREGASGAWPPPFTVPVAALGAERVPPPSSRPADPPYLDLPTPLSPIMRIFRVVSTSSSILTPRRSEPSWQPRFGSQPFTRAICPRMRPAPRLPPSFYTGCLSC